MKRGTYKYSETVGVYPVAKFMWHRLRVEIISETEKSYTVKLLAYHATNKKGPGDIMTVRKSSVTLDAVEQPKPPHITPDDGIRLPYKDND